MKKMMQIKIDVNKIDKQRLYPGKKGTYLTAAIILHDETDEYGNDGVVIEQISKEERESGHKGTILGNVKFLEKKKSTETNRSAKNEKFFMDGLPF